MNFKKIENLSAIVMLVAFFLPWLSMGIFSLSGYKAATMGGVATLLFLIPILAVVVLVNDVQSFFDDVKTKYLTYVTALIPLIYIVSRIVDMGGQFFQGASIGIYLTLLASVTMLLGAFGIVKLPEWYYLNFNLKKL